MQHGLPQHTLISFPIPLELLNTLSSSFVSEETSEIFHTLEQYTFVFS